MGREGNTELLSGFVEGSRRGFAVSERASRFQGASLLIILERPSWLIVVL